ncbi:cytochrome ubiquinol oxidase subunit II [Fluviibacterium sp. S390]|uniref:cytochrome ubiquinol oxidase subunit II n=1 Tax=Fluviibacterium sp. S390 TaxID=3415139 RepID=UPI003C7D7C86
MACLSRFVVLTILAIGVVIHPDLAAADASFWTPAGPVAADQKAHFIRVTLLTMVAVVPVLVLVPLMLWRYRYRNTKAKFTPDWEYSGPLDLLMWGVPVVIVAVLSVQLWQSVKRLDPYRPVDTSTPILHVQVVGLDWKWLFVYPDLGIASIGELAFPTNRQVGLSLTSDTVMQSFVVSALAGQIYVMPGMTTNLHLEADAPGRFQGQNTQFNGEGFTQQKFDAIGMSEQAFEHWVASVRDTGVPLDPASYEVVSARSTQAEARGVLGTDAMPDDALYFSSIPDDFFTSIEARYHAGVAVSAAHQPGAPAPLEAGTR